jgi:hypothetical protein
MDYDTEIADYMTLPSEFNTENDILSFDLFTSTNIFPVLQKNQRHKLSQRSKKDPSIIIEVPVIREFFTDTGHHVVVNGPVLDTSDHLMVSILITLYLEEGRLQKGLLTTTLKDIRDKLGVTNSATANNKISRSLNRLQQCSFAIFRNSTQLWSKSFIKDWSKKGTRRAAFLEIELNIEWVVECLKNTPDLTSLELSSFTELSGDYAQALYRLILFLLKGSKNLKVEVDLKELWSYLHLKTEDSPVWVELSTTARNNFRKSIRKAIAELNNKDLICSSSSIDGQTCVLYKNYRSEKAADLN